MHTVSEPQPGAGPDAVAHSHGQGFRAGYMVPNMPLTCRSPGARTIARMTRRNEGRREFLRVTLGGGLAAAVLARCGGSAVESVLGSSSGDAGSATDAGSASDAGSELSCVLDPTTTKGPYWVDEGLERADIRADTNGRATPNPRPGLPLTLELAVYSYAAGACTPLSGAQVDIWHCDASGIYSDVQGVTAGQDFLRGYQVTGANGVARFTTIYPGWYSGRTVHIHVKVRIFDAARNTTTEATTQIFFDDAITDVIFRSISPYSSRPSRDTRNASDGIYGNQTILLSSLSGDIVSGFTASISLGVKVGQINAG
jgi:protocatechuate 3,4-dioxygenase beta subunit